MSKYKKFPLYVPNCSDKRMLMRENPVFSDSVEYVMVGEVALAEGSVFVAYNESFVFVRDDSDDGRFVISNMSRRGYRSGFWFLSHSDAVAKVKESWSAWTGVRAEAKEKRRRTNSDEEAKAKWKSSGFRDRAAMPKVYLAIVCRDGEERCVCCDSDLDLVAKRLIDIDYGDGTYSIKDLIIGADGVNMYCCGYFITSFKHRDYTDHHMLSDHIMWKVEEYKKAVGYE
jgi:hypothetical protein